MADPITINGTPVTSWSDLMQYLQAMGVDTTNLPSTLQTAQEVMEWVGQNYTPIYTVKNVLSGFTQIQAVDPTVTTDIVPRGLYELVATGAGGTASLGAGSWGLATVPTVLGAVLSVLGIAVTAGLVAEGIRDALENEVRDWTIDGEYVPVWIDGQGMTTVQEGLIEAVRNKAAELGAFEDAQAVFPETQTTGTYTITSLGNAKDILDYLLSHTQKYKYVFTGTIYDEIVTFLNTYSNCLIQIRFFDSTGGFRGWSPLNIYAFTTLNPNSSFNINSTSYNYVSIATSGNTGGTAGNYTLTINDIRYDSGRSSVPCIGKLIDGSYVVATNADATMSSPVEGTTLFDDFASMFKDTTKNISQIAQEAFPDWYNKHINLAAPTVGAITGTTSWYPVSLQDTDPFEDGTVSDETAQDGETVPDTQAQIIGLLTGLIGDLTTTDDPPTIEVGDSGDTPPALPPLISGASNGLWCIYNPTLAEVQQFGGWLWSENLIDQIVRQFNNPIEAVIGFHIMYAIPITGASRVIKAGYLESPVSAKEVVNQYVEIDCGSIPIQEYYKTAVDYTLTKIDLFLPFIGVVPLDASVVMGSTLNVLYRIDVLTGTCLAQVKVIKQNSNAVLYTYNGNCAVQLPLTASTYTGMVGALVNLGQAALSGFIGDFPTAGMEVGQAVGSFISNKTGTAKSGYIGSNAGSLGIRIPYVIITHPTAYDAYLYNSMYGYPSNTLVTLGSQSGYTRVKDIHPSGFSATEDEVDMIVRLLKEGVIIQ